MAQAQQKKRESHVKFVTEYFSTHAYPGDEEIGLELEEIGVRLPDSFSKNIGWTIHQDDSIKPRNGEVGREYTFNGPKPRKDLNSLLKALEAEFIRCKAVVAEDRLSNSVHVHVDANKLTFQQVYTWLTLYFLFEELLVEWAGPDRPGNLFCLRAKDAEGLVDMLRNCAKHNDYTALGSDDYRYSAANTAALAKFGSLEFRALRGTFKMDVIQKWVEMLLMIKDRALTYTSPVDVLREFKLLGPMNFMCKTFSFQYRDVFLTHGFDRKMRDGMWLAQEFAHARTWATELPDFETESKKWKNREEEVLKKSSLDDLNDWHYPPTWANVQFSPGTTQPTPPSPTPSPALHNLLCWIRPNVPGCAISLSSNEFYSQKVRLNIPEGAIIPWDSQKVLTWYNSPSGVNGQFLGYKNSNGQVIWVILNHSWITEVFND